MLTKEIIHMGYGDDPINGKTVIAQAKQEIENGNLFVGNTFEEYVLIQKIRGQYHLGTYSIISHDGTNAILPKPVVDDLFNTILSEEGSDDFFYIDTHGDSHAMDLRADIVDAILQMKEEHAPKARPELHFAN